MPPTDPAAVEILSRGQIEVEGRIVEASNATLLCTVSDGADSVRCVYKPIRGERPLWDFADGTLADREVASYLISEASGWSLIPPTLLRDGPLGPGMVQLWIDTDEDAELVDVVGVDRVPCGWRRVLRAHDRLGEPALLVHADTPELRQLTALDVMLNNADRKGGHVLVGTDGRTYGVDHGVCLHHEEKLRTVLWGFLGEPIGSDIVRVLHRLGAELDGGELGERLSEHLTRREVDALCRRAERLVNTETYPSPNGSWPAIPWPAF